jgi:transposase
LVDTSNDDIKSIAQFHQVNGRNLQSQYKNFLSEYMAWDQKPHARQTSLSHGELYTILTNKKAKARKGSIVAIVKGTKAEQIIEVLDKIPLKERRKVREITLDMAGNMELIAKRSFPNATLVTDRFHVQKPATEALQEIRIKHRWEAIDQENEQIEQAKKNNKKHIQQLLPNGDTLKQLLARSRYVLYKKPKKWTESQRERAEILFSLYPDIAKAYGLSQKLTAIFNETTDKILAFTKFAKWHE